MSLVFYDTETTGTETFFDQILQFAAIRTDANLNEIDRFEVRCRLLPHVVPAPGAMRVTGVRAAQLFAAEFALIVNYSPEWNGSGYGSKVPGVGRPGTDRVSRWNEKFPKNT